MGINLQQKLQDPFQINNQIYPNPIWLASGTCGFGEDLVELIDLTKLGGIVLKGTTLHPKDGNETPRVAETPAGMLNAIGLQNPGIHVVIKEKIPFMKQFNIPIILNISGICTDDGCSSIQEFETLSKIIANETEVQGIEVNISCPNVKGRNLGTDPVWIEKTIKAVKKHAIAPVITKLTPNVTDITTIAKAAENGGTDALSLINTPLGMKFDIHTQKPVLANKMGGLSGPAIRPIAIRATYQVRQSTTLPIIGMGGIMNQDDVFEFFLAGANAVQVGTLTFIDLNALKTLLKNANKTQ